MAVLEEVVRDAAFKAHNQENGRRGPIEAQLVVLTLSSQSKAGSHVENVLSFIGATRHA